MLAFIDYNTHLGRDHLTKSNGTPVFVVRFRKHTKQWYATPVLCEKTYSYISGMKNRFIFTEEFFSLLYLFSFFILSKERDQWGRLLLI